jgi:DNA/RNA endonuclease G (NUC1)
MAIRKTSKKRASVKPAEPASRPPVDVFISYARNDQAVAARLAKTLKSEGFDVWFDSAIYAGADWQELLVDTLNSAKAVVVLWSRNSVRREWVLKEANIAQDTRRLVPVVIDDCQLPKGFTKTQASILRDWDGGPDHAELPRLLDGLAKLAPPSRVETVRPGYDSNFLGVEVPLPAVLGVGEEFRYLHFSVVMNPARRLAWYSAYNMEPSVRVARGDHWLPDPMLPRAFQPGNEHFTGTGYDRGHIVASSSVSWGPERQAQLANHQAFFWTNTAPQLPEVNRDSWLAIEMWERKLVMNHKRAIGFSGPVLADGDPPHGADEQLIGRLRVRYNFRLPQAFWKIVVTRDAKGALEVAAFMVDQRSPSKHHGVRPIGQVKAEGTHYRVSVSQIEARTGLDFGANFRGAKNLPEEA